MALEASEELLNVCGSHLTCTLKVGKDKRCCKEARIILIDLDTKKQINVCSGHWCGMLDFMNDGVDIQAQARGSDVYPKGNR